MTYWKWIQRSHPECSLPDCSLPDRSRPAASLPWPPRTWGPKRMERQQAACLKYKHTKIHWLLFADSPSMGWSGLGLGCRMHPCGQASLTGHSQRSWLPKRIQHSQDGDQDEIMSSRGSPTQKKTYRCLNVCSRKVWPAPIVSFIICYCS